MKRQRVAELHFYEWRASTWAVSETRDRLDAAGRGIYRELIDQCNTQGKFPDDVEWICRKCACTREQYEKAWPHIVRHFPISNESGYRWNVPANIVRREYFTFVEKQREVASKRWADKRNGINDEDRLPSGYPEAYPMPNNNGNTTAIVIPPNPHAPNGAHSRGKKAKRSTEEIHRALGERLTWWENFWKVYPCHEGKNPCMDAFERKVKTHETAVAVFRGAQRYASQAKANPDLKLKFGQGWINDERWTDESVSPISHRQGLLL